MAILIGGSYTEKLGPEEEISRIGQSWGNCERTWGESGFGSLLTQTIPRDELIEIGPAAKQLTAVMGGKEE
jgi:hypothetical protein